MLTLHFDYVSPAAIVAMLRLQRLADEGGAVTFSGIDVLGLDVAVPPTLDQLEELAVHQARARDLGLPMRRPSLRPPTLLAHLVGQLADVRGLGAAWRHACATAYWAEDQDLSAPAVLRSLADTVGLDTVEVDERLGDMALRNAARQRMLTRRRGGIGGVPVLDVDGTLVSADLDDADLQQLVSAV